MSPVTQYINILPITVTFLSKIAGVWEAFFPFILMETFSNLSLLLFHHMCKVFTFSSFSPLTFQLFCLFRFFEPTTLQEAGGFVRLLDNTTFNVFLKLFHCIMPVWTFSSADHRLSLCPGNHTAVHTVFLTSAYII